MGHWHLNSSDIEASKKIFVAMGGTAMKPGDFELVRFPGVLINLHLRQPAPPANGGTIGSVVNHVGFIVNDVQASTARWKAAGVPVEPGSNGRLDQAYVTTPDGLRIEILEDKNQSVPIRHEHCTFIFTRSRDSGSAGLVRQDVWRQGRRARKQPGGGHSGCADAICQD